MLPEGIFYTKVRPDDVPEIVETTLKKGEPVERLLYKEPDTGRVCRTAGGDTLLSQAAAVRAREVRGDRSGEHRGVHRRKAATRPRPRHAST